MTECQKGAVYACVLLFAACMFLLLLPQRKGPVFSGMQSTVSADVKESASTPSPKIPGLTAVPRKNIPADEEPEVWVYDTDNDARKQSTVHDNVSCYPRIFAVGSVDAAPPSSCRGGRPLPAAESKPRQHVFFLKTHKTGSLTVTTLLNRYAVLHNLSVARQRRVESRANGSKADWSATFAPPPAGRHYDMVTNPHLVFKESCVRRFLPEDSVLISIMRDPLQRFISAFHFIGVERRVPGDFTVLTYLSDVERWDSRITAWGSILHSSMAKDFGLHFQNLGDPQYLPTSLHNLSRVFHLVMLTEAFEESMVLLRRMLSWKLPEMMYTKFHVNQHRPAYNITEEQKLDFENHRKEEYAIYRHFREEFYGKIEAQDDSFAEEVGVFRSMRHKVDSFCQNINGRRYRRRELMVEGTAFSDRFRITAEDCWLFKKPLVGTPGLWFDEVMGKRWEEGPQFE